MDKGARSSRSTEALTRPLRTLRGRDGPVLDRPSATAAAVQDLPAGAQLPVFGRYGDYLLVEAPGGTRGWVAAN